MMRNGNEIIVYREQKTSSHAKLLSMSPPNNPDLGVALKHSSPSPIPPANTPFHHTLGRCCASIRPARWPISTLSVPQITSGFASRSIRSLHGESWPAGESVPPVALDTALHNLTFLTAVEGAIIVSRPLTDTSPASEVLHVVSGLPTRCARAGCTYVRPLAQWTGYDSSRNRTYSFIPQLSVSASH